MDAGKYIALTNLVLALISLGVSVFPVFWLKTHNGTYKSGLQLLIPALAQSSVGCLIFAILYTLLLFDIITPATIQTIARPVNVIFLLLPFTLVVSLHFWKIGKHEGK